MIPAPDGLVTMVFAEAPDAASVAPARACLEASGGYEVKTSGGKLMAAFASAADAARFVLASLESCAEIRLGAHTGEPIREPDPSTGRADYFGPAVNRAARVADAAHPGQALLSRPALEAAGDALAGAAISPVGEHRLKGLERPEALFQVLPASLRDRKFPPLRTLTALPTNLPVQTTSFVGRESELVALEGVFAGGARLVALTGPAGVGKTRLAVRLGAELLEKFEGGCWFVDFAEAGGAGDGGSTMAGLVAQALGVALGGGAPAAEQVAAVLASRRPLLLILDTWEVAGRGAAQALEMWLARAPKLRVFVTGRSSTGLAGEQAVLVEPFPVPVRGRPEDAIRLFVERAREAKPDFVLTPGAEEDVAAICRELEGIPLAIELAAARVKIMQPAMMRRKLGQKFQLLKFARQDAAQRQQTLSGAIEWGLETLTPVERRIFLMLSVFRGGFMAEAAARVVGPEATLERIEALRARSLLAARDYPWGRRYLLYRLLHEYAEREWQAVSTREERIALERRHAEVALGYMREWVEKSATSLMRESLDRLEAAMENLAAVQDRALLRAAAASTPGEMAGELEIAARAVDCLTIPHNSRGSSADWLARADLPLRAVLAAPAAAALMDPEIRAGLLDDVSEACRATGNNARAVSLARDAVTSASRRPDSPACCRALRILAWLDAVAGRFEPALLALDRAAVIARTFRDTGPLAQVLNTRGIALRRKGATLEALESFREAWRVSHEAGAAAYTPAFASNIATTLEMTGRVDEALEWYEKAEKGAEAVGRLSSIAVNMTNRANLLSRRGDHQAALGMFDAAETMIREIGRPALVAACFAMRSAALGRAGRPAEGLEASIAAEKIFRELGDSALLASLLGERAPLLRAVGDDRAALLALDQSIAVFRDLGNRPAMIETVTARAGILRTAGRFADARDSLREALAGRGDLPALAAFEALVALALAEEDSGDVAAAKTAARDARSRLQGTAWEGSAREVPIRESLAQIDRLLAI